MRAVLAVATLLSAVIPAAGQELVEMLPFPDSMAGIYKPSCVLYCSTYGTVWVGGDGGRRVVVFDATTRERLAVLPSGREIQDMCFDPVNDRVYVAAKYDCTVWVYDAANNEVVDSIPVGTWPDDVECSPTDFKAYCLHQGDSTVWVIDGMTRSVVDTVELGQYIAAIVHYPARNVLFCIGYDTDVVDCSSDSVLTRIHVESGSGKAQLCPDIGKLYTVGDGQGTVCVIDVDRDTLLSKFDLGGNPVDVEYSREDRKLYVSYAFYYGLDIIDCQGDSLIKTVMVHGDRTRLTHCELDDSRVLLCATYAAGQRSITFVDTRRDSVTGVLELPTQHPYVSCWSPDDGLAFVSTVSSANLLVVNPLTRTIVDSVLIGGWVYDLCISTRENKLYSAGIRCRVVGVYDFDTEMQSTAGPVGFYCRDLVYNSVDNTVWTANRTTSSGAERDSTLSVIDCATDSVLGVVEVGPTPVALAFNPDENKVYSANEEGSLSVVDCAAMTEVARIPTDLGEGDLCYCPGVNKLYFARDDDTVYVLDGRGDTLLNKLYTGWQSQVRDLCFDPNLERVYCLKGDRVFAIDCSSDAIVASHPDLDWAGYCVADSATGKLFVASASGSRPFPVYRFNGSDLDLEDTTWFFWPVLDLAFNHANGHLYVLGLGPYYVGKLGIYEGDLTLVDTVTLGDIDFFDSEMAVDERTNRVYVANSGSADISVVQDRGLAVRQVLTFAEPESATQTVVRGILRLQGTHPATLYDIGGRKAAPLTPGDNDVKLVRPGVYFVRTEDGKPTAKVVVAR